MLKRSFYKGVLSTQSNMIGIISDTHENEEAIKKAVKVFKDRNVEFVVHCGDIISPPMLEYFRGLKMKFVFGNNDGEKIGLKNKCGEYGFDEIKYDLEFGYKGKKFYVYHGTKKEELETMLTNFRERWNSAYTNEEKTFCREKIVGIEKELKRRV